VAWRGLFIKQPEGKQMSSMKELLYQRETAAFMIAERMEEIKQLRSEIDRLRQQIRDVRASIV
jgi:polyhydroxyalkanoate synthesis regulator phasin